MGSPLVPNGMLDPSDTWSKFANIRFVILQLLSKMQTATLVEVQSCTNDGGLSPFGFVNVLPLVNQVDGNDNPLPQPILFDVPYVRLQGGSYAVILDPAPGDIGIAIFASRDISSVKSTQGQANPGSGRQYNISDGLYIGGLLNAAPSQYVQFSAAGIKIVSPTEITLQAPTIILNGNVSQTNGTISAETDVTAGPNSISLVNHKHTSEAVGSPTSEPLP